MSPKSESLSTGKLLLLCVSTWTVGACSAQPGELAEFAESRDSIEFAESSESTGRLPDATALQALDAESLTLSDSSSTEGENVTVDIPEMCANAGLRKAFLSGRQRGARWSYWLWNHFARCGEVETFTDALMVLVENIDVRIDTDKGAQRCRHAGIVEGVIAAVERLQTTCEAECYAKGESVGSINATAYCELAIATAGQMETSSWSREPVGLCGFAYEMGCDATFLGKTASYVTGQGDACARYTSEPYARVWTFSRLKSCDYYLFAPGVRVASASATSTPMPYTTATASDSRVSLDVMSASRSDLAP